tara:strand:+ start:387 stop:503 length:117 start_codon:yes stop_codon:yes gene_type:complete
MKVVEVVLVELVVLNQVQLQGQVDTEVQVFRTILQELQ